MRSPLLALLVLTACSKTPEPTPTSGPADRPATTADRPGPTSGAGATPAPTGAAGAVPTDIAWEAPAAWQKAENPSAMRKATYKIPKAAGDSEDAELSVSQAGGGLEANVKRWEGQFEDKAATKKEDKKVNDLKVTVVELKGKFMGGGMPGGPPAEAKPGWMLLGAIVETKTPYFFKLTGPEKTVAAARADFDKLVESFRAK